MKKDHSEIYYEDFKDAVVVGSFWGIDSYLWTISISSVKGNRRCMINTGYHTFWADQFVKKVEKSQGLQKFYNIDHLKKKLKEQEINYAQPGSWA